MSRFVNGLVAYIEHEVKLLLPYSFDLEYQKALNCEKYLRIVHRWPSFNLDTRPSRLGTFPKSNPST